MNRTDKFVTAFTLILAGLLLVSAQPVMADTVGPLRFKYGVTIYSPVNTTYNSRNILFNYTFAVGMGMHYSLNYMLDGNLVEPMPYSVINPQELHVVYLAIGQVQLPELSEGTHSLTISLQATFGKNDIRSYSDTISFTIDTNAPDVALDTVPPNIIIQSPQTHQTYTTAVPLNLLLSEPVTQLIVHLDGNKTTLPNQNTTLGGLTAGTHSLTVTAIDLAGNPGYANHVTFNVIQPPLTHQPTPTPTVPEFSSWIIPLLVITMLATAGLLVYRKNDPRKILGSC